MRDCVLFAPMARVGDILARKTPLGRAWGALNKHSHGRRPWHGAGWRTQELLSNYIPMAERVT